MAELSVATVEEHTQGRLDRDDPMTERLLAEWLGAARRWCGWHVTPELPSDVIEVDGPGGRLLVLPTLHLSTLHEVVENGVPVDVAGLEVSRRGLVRKAAGFWTDRFGGITVTMTHGFAEAPAFNAAVLSMIDRAALSSSGAPLGIGPFRWSEAKLTAGDAFTEEERGLLQQYRLEPQA